MVTCLSLIAWTVLEGRCFKTWLDVMIRMVADHALTYTCIALIQWIAVQCLCCSLAALPS